MAFDSHIGGGPVQHTLRRAAACEGVGLHSGRPARLVLRPAPTDAGVVFVRTDVRGLDNRVPVSPAAVVETTLHTELANPAGVRVLTIEHLMAALTGLGVDNAVVELDGPELPIMDGSAQPFVELIDRAGLAAQAAPRRWIEVLRSVEVRDGEKRAALRPAFDPADGLTLDVEIAFDAEAIGRQRFAVAVTPDAFRRELAAARTFGFARDVEALRARGLARGGGLDNAVVVDGARVLNPQGLRFPDEFARHKTMDALGDLFVLGLPLIGRFEAERTGHGLNNALARAVLADRSAWRVRTLPAPQAFARAS